MFDCSAQPDVHLAVESPTLRPFCFPRSIECSIRTSSATSQLSVGGELDAELSVSGHGINRKRLHRSC